MGTQLQFGEMRRPCPWAMRWLHSDMNVPNTPVLDTEESLRWFILRYEDFTKGNPTPDPLQRVPF